MHKQIIKLAFPILLSQGIRTVMLLADRFVLSLKNPLFPSAATTAGFTAISLSLFFVHMMMFSTSLIGKKFGQNDLRGCKILLKQSQLIALISAPILLLIGTLIPYYFSFLGHPKEYILIEQSYFKVMLISQSIILFRAAIESYFLGIQKTKDILKSNLIALITNVPLSYLFVLGPFSEYFSMANGAAWAAVIANIFALSFILLRLKKISKDVAEKVCWSEAIKDREFIPYLKQGSCNGSETWVSSFCFACFANMFVLYGNEVSTAVSIVFSWDQIAFLPLIGIYGAVMSLYSMYLGQDTPEKATHSLHSALRVTFALMLILSTFFWVFRHILVGVFIKEHSDMMDLARIHEYSAFFLKTTSVYIFANATIFLYKAALRSEGYSGFCFKISFLSHIALVACCFTWIHYLKMGPVGVWNLFMAMLFSLSLVYMIKYYRSVIASRKQNLETA